MDIKTTDDKQKIISIFRWRLKIMYQELEGERDYVRKNCTTEEWAKINSEYKAGTPQETAEKLIESLGDFLAEEVVIYYETHSLSIPDAKAFVKHVLGDLEKEEDREVIKAAVDLKVLYDSMEPFILKGMSHTFLDWVEAALTAAQSEKIELTTLLARNDSYATVTRALIPTQEEWTKEQYAVIEERCRMSIEWVKKRIWELAGRMHQ